MAVALGSQHTASFPQFLSQLGVSLLVSTYQAGKLIILRADGDQLNTHYVTLPKPMGIAGAGARLSVGTGHQVLEYFNMPATAPKVEPAGKHDACYLPRRSHITGDIDIHEMAYTPDNELWLVNTRMSCLCTLDDEHSVVPRWRPPFVSAYDVTDRCHLNGLALRDGKPTYVTSLGVSDKPAGWRDNKAHGGMLMDIRDDSFIAQELSMPHSPRWYNDKLWVLESGAGTLAQVDPASGALDEIVSLPGFTRGLDFVGRYAVIGLSQVRETAVFAGLPLTEKFKDRHCGIWVVDLMERKVIAYLVFSEGVQEIFAVSAVPARYPAVLDLADPLLHSSYSLPDTALKQFSVPDPRETRFREALALRHKGKLEAAINAYQELLMDYPDHLVARFQLGATLGDAGRFEDSLQALEQVVAEDPLHAEAHNVLGSTLANLARWDEALAHYDQALAADQAYALAHFNKSLLQLKLGRYHEAWPGFEWRWKLPNYRPFDTPQPKWQGEDISGKTLLVHTEPGDSKSFLFARFIPLAAKHCKRLILACPEPMHSLLNAMDGVDEAWVAQRLPRDAFDVFCPLMSLPAALGNITLDSLPVQVPYLQEPREVVVPTLESNGGLKIGLAWQPEAGAAAHNPGLPALGELLELCGGAQATVYALQQPAGESEASQLAGGNARNLASELASYAHAAAVLRQLDLVITSDNALAHLAGALGKPVWLLLPQQSDWCWQQERTDSPWYPTARLWRGTKDSDWKTLLQSMAGELAKISKTA